MSSVIGEEKAPVPGPVIAMAVNSFGPKDEDCTL
jgi:hypothetical protein